MSQMSMHRRFHLRQTADRGLRLQRGVRTLLRPVVRAVWPCRLEGYDAVPAKAAAILCPNHLSFFDAVLMMLTVQRPIRFLGKIEYLDSWKTRYLLPALGMIPIDRETGVQTVVALDTAGAVLAGGGLLCIFPEGTRSRDGNLHRGYSGAARLALEHGCPLLPVGIDGTRRILPPGARVPRPWRRCSISIGAPMRIYAGNDDTRVAARTATDRMMLSIAELSGQIYVPEYTLRSFPTATPTSRPSPRRQRRFGLPAIGRTAAPRTNHGVHTWSADTMW